MSEMPSMRLTPKGIITGFLMFDERGPMISNMDNADTYTSALMEELFRRGWVLQQYDPSTGALK